MDKTTHDKGLEIRKAVLGEAYVEAAISANTSRAIRKLSTPAGAPA